MDISTYTKQQGQFLKAEHVNAHKNMVWIMDTTTAKMVTSDKFNTERLHISVTLGDDTYTFDMSKTNARTVEAVLGSDTARWNNNGLVLETYKTKTTEGKMTEAINVKEVKKLL